MGRFREITVDLTPLRQREFRLLWTGSIVSSLGTTMTRIAVPYQVYKLTGSTLWVGIVAGLTIVPNMVGGIVGGAMADSYDRRRIARIVAAVSLLCSLGLALNAATVEWVPLIFLLQILATGSQAVGSPASRSAVAILVPRDLLPSAAALQSLSYSTAFVLGPALGGLVLAWAGPTGAFLVDAASFLAPLIAWTLLAPMPHAEGTARASRATVLDGVRALKGRRVVVASFLADLDAMVFGMPTALFPAVVVHRFHGDTQVLGLLAGAPFAGAMLATLTSGWCKRIHRQGLGVVVSVVVWGLGIVGFGMAGTLALSLAALALAGAADMVSGVFRQSILQTATPRELQGRMAGVGMAVWTSGPALGDLEAGAVAAVTSIDASIVVGGIACIVGILALAGAIPELLTYDARVTPAAEPQPAPAPA